PIAYDHDDGVSEVLELAQLAQAHSVAERQVRCARVESHLKAQGAPRLQGFYELVARNNVDNGSLSDPAEFVVRGNPSASCFPASPSVFLAPNHSPSTTRARSRYLYAFERSA